MAKNRAHGESFQKRLNRFQQGPPTESIDTLLNSISNFFNNEIKEASENNQTTLLFLGIHASILTISEALFNKRGLNGYKYFLENFMDGESEDLKFSIIAYKIHDWRNILAHQWLGSAGHKFGYDYEMDEGWKEFEDVLYINPRKYCEQYIETFSAGSSLWKYKSYLNQDDLEEVKERIIKKFVKK